ncbi:MAG: C_GCAxxG_C_C family protein [Deltaproteobacteria bacterium]|nr:C_GCAxxG_C_C family protein [Deltaproteobacteria bacterium]
MLSDSSYMNWLNEMEASTSVYTGQVRGCAPRCVATIMKYLDLADSSAMDIVLKAAIPLSGGIIQSYNICGALLGGIMAISISLLREKKEEEASRDEIMTLNHQCREYYRRFEKEIGHARCFDIRQVGLGRCFDTADPDDYEKFVKAGGHDFCAKVIGKAARLAVESILETNPSLKNIIITKKEQ